MTNSIGPAVLNLAILFDMYGDNSSQTLCQALSGFRSEAGLYISQLQQALVAADQAETAKLSHSLKSMCGLIGASQLMTLCQTIEQAARQRDKVALANCEQELALVWQALKLQLQRTLQDHGHADA